jgi:hypothetical protein
MSHAHDASAHPKTEDDRVDSRTVLLVGVGALVVFVLAGLAASTYLSHVVAERPGPPLPAEIGQTKIGLVEQKLFDQPLRGAADKAARVKRLGAYGWVDEGKQVAHLPIEVAMELVASGVRATPTVPPTAPPLSAIHGGVDAPSVPIAGEPAPAVAKPAAPAAKGARK